VNVGRVMEVDEFHEAGFLQEVNRLFLHPLGLALEIRVEGEKKMFGRIWDYRDDPEGLVFADGEIDAKKAQLVEDMRASKAETRMRKLGFIVQPVDEQEGGEKV
jgi:hypothetical protein